MKCILRPETLGEIHKKGIPTLPKQDRYPIIICKNRFILQERTLGPKKEA